MCGRFVKFSPLEDLLKDYMFEEEYDEYTPDYNISPQKDILSLIQNPENNQYTLTRFKWGLVPSWSKEPSTQYSMINARCETLSEKPSYKNLLSKRRCVILADGFYEWRKEGNKKIPYYITFKGKKFIGFAGLYDIWHSKTNSSELKTCTIITCPSNTKISAIHDRMPVIIDSENINKWLSNSSEKIDEIFKPYYSENTIMYEVNRIINSSSANSPDNIKAVESDITLFKI